MSSLNLSQSIDSSLPSSIIQVVTEIVPDYVLGADPVIKGAKIHPYTLRMVNECVRELWCTSRVYGYAGLYASGEDGLSFRVGWGNPNSDEILVTSMSTKTNYAHYRQVNVFNGTKCGDPWFYHSSILTDEAYEAYCLYQFAIQDLAIRVKNSIQTLVNIFDDSDEDLTGAVDKNIIQRIDEEYNKSRRIYGTGDSKLSGLTASIEGVEQVMEGFWINLARLCKIPLWMMQKEAINSSFSLELIENSLTKYWKGYAELPYYQILRYLGMSDHAVLIVPCYRNAQYQTTIADIQASTDQRVAAANKLTIGAIVEKHKLENGLYDKEDLLVDDLTPSDRSREDLTKENITEVQPHGF